MIEKRALLIYRYAMNLINKKLLAQKVESFKNYPDGVKLENDKKIVEGWIKSLKQDNLENTKEKSVEKSFLIRFFADILGYQELGSLSDTSNLYPDYTIEKSAGSDTLYADGALGFFSKDKNVVKAVIELKDALTPLDKKQSGREKGYTPVGQAFQYAQKIDGCNWIIVSNFKEIRLYNKQRSDELYEAINVLELANPENFKRFYYLLCRENLICDGPKSVIDSVLLQSVENDEDITKKFYAEYKIVRVKFFEHLQKHNPNLDKHTLLEKTQKLLDRFIFVLFCEDTNGLLPLNISKETYELGKKSRERSDEKIWREFRNLFMDIDEGRIDVDPQINKYNGGLFRKDETLDAMSIKDEIWEELMRLTRWDFDSELNVNILGHIFEQSISDLETLRAEISGEQVDKSKSKRKKEGVYYTPEYITKYIVENTVGRWLEENPDKLENVTILDPACGSGAFLNQAHSFLMKQFKLRNEEAMLNSKGKMQLFNYHVAETTILSKNLYGVDLNEESVEITKLSLWLKTATKSEPLQNLDNNIKCGNSLIDDPAVAGQKAFKWETEFKDVQDAGGFDVVVSNPPYVFAREKISEIEKDHYQKAFISSEYQVNTFVLFIEQSLKLIKDAGFLGVIVPNSLLMISSISKLRELILKTSAIREIVSLRGFSFENVSVETVILILQKGLQTTGVKTTSFLMEKETKSISSENQLLVDGCGWRNNARCEFNVSVGKIDEPILRKLNENPRLEDCFVVKAGLKAYEVGKGDPEQSKDDLENRIYDFDKKIDENTYPYLDGENINRFIVYRHAYYLKYGKHLAAPRTFDIFSRPRILIREITDDFPRCLMAVFTDEIYLNNLSIINVLSPNDDRENLKALTGILNSKLLSYYFIKSTPKAARSMFPKLILQDLRQFPLPNLDGNSALLADIVDKLQEKEKHLFEFVDSANKYIENEYKTKIKLTANYDWKIFNEKIEKQKNRLNNAQKEDLLSWFEGKKAKIRAFDDEVDALENRLNQEIYKLYGLISDEIKIVEEGTA